MHGSAANLCMEGIDLRGPGTAYGIVPVAESSHLLHYAMRRLVDAVISHYGVSPAIRCYTLTGRNAAKSHPRIELRVIRDTRCVMVALRRRLSETAAPENAINAVEGHRRRTSIKERMGWVGSPKR